MSNSTTNFDGAIHLPTTTQIETNYYNAVIDNGVDPVAAIDLLFEVLVQNGPPDTLNWYNWAYGAGVNLDPGLGHLHQRGVRGRSWRQIVLASQRKIDVAGGEPITQL